MTYELLSNDNYYDIDALVCEYTPVPCIFTHDCIALGHLESVETEDITVNTKLEISWWLMLFLAMQDHVTVCLPAKLYGTKFLNSVTEDTVLYTDLASRCIYYYELGQRYAWLNDDSQLINSVRIVYNNRYNVVLHRSTTQRSNDHNTFTSKLTHSETQLMDIKHFIALTLRDWRERWATYMRASHLTHHIQVLQNITNIAAKQDSNKHDNGQSTALTKQPSKFANTRTQSNYGDEDENSYANKRQRA